MNRTELTERLRREEVPDALYEIPGVHGVPVQLDAYYVLRPEGDAWPVLLRQRGQEEVIARFATEAEACDYLYDTLTDVPPPSPGGAARIERLLADAEEIQRQAEEDFERAPDREDGGTGVSEPDA
ncbi:hypothetical protein AB0I87_03325 [Streptomyces sp. NPDC049952]|uniref:hypothetical protein n=1 Tax=Streptomyces TaxID=1883 RepID=UPI00192640ED|nr:MULTISPECIES: hypothetical protein [Streptomyces]MEE1776461.1 hypothetical protein [Streptomyces sp. JV181]WSK29056.1 hypothetical protein OG483_14745 [[Kitasatospora] papulosa]